MLSGRVHLNYSPLRIILNLLSTILSYDLVDELDDELNIEDEDEEGNLFLFPRLDLDFFLFILLGCFTISGLDKGNFFSFSLICVVYLAHLLKKSLGFLKLSLLAHNMSYLQFYDFFLLCIITGVNYRGK